MSAAAPPAVEATPADAAGGGGGAVQGTTAGSKWHVTIALHLVFPQLKAKTRWRLVSRMQRFVCALAPGGRSAGRATVAGSSDAGCRGAVSPAGGVDICVGIISYFVQSGFAVGVGIARVSDSFKIAGLVLRAGIIALHDGGTNGTSGTNGVVQRSVRGVLGILILD